ncbi:MAG: hypothetical protein ACSHXK_02190 [Oceanococcus sp.]
MNQDNKADQELVDNIRQALDAQSAEPDELTRAALRAARYRAIDEMPQKSTGFLEGLWSRWSLAGAGAACAVLLAWGLQSPPNNLEVASVQTEDAALIADLDLVLWLEDGDV